MRPLRYLQRQFWIPEAHPGCEWIMSYKIVRRRRKKVIRTRSPTMRGGRRGLCVVNHVTIRRPAPTRRCKTVAISVPPIRKRGWLRHGNPPGDPTTARRCGARTRTNQACGAPAIKGKRRCRMHGGRSTGPRTAAGRARSARARWKHGAYSADSERQYRKERAWCAGFNAQQQAYHGAVRIAMRLMSKDMTIDLRNARRRRRYHLARSHRSSDA